MKEILPEASLSPQVEQTVSTLLNTPFDWERLLSLVVLLVICLAVMKVLLVLLDRLIVRMKVERSLHTFLRSGIRFLLWFITIMILADSQGIPITSLLGMLGIIGLAVSLALQGILSNLAGGIMILISKPFVVGDEIEAGGVSGIAHEIGLVYTEIRTFDNKIIFVPNGEISAEQIINYTRQDKRRVDLVFNVSYDADPEQVKACIQSVIASHPKALADPAPFARVSGYLDSSVAFTVRVWCVTADYWDLKSDLLEQIKAAFDAAGIELTYNHLEVHLVERQIEGPDRRKATPDGPDRE